MKKIDEFKKRHDQLELVEIEYVGAILPEMMLIILQGMMKKRRRRRGRNSPTEPVNKEMEIFRWIFLPNLINTSFTGTQRKNSQP